MPKAGEKRGSPGRGSGGGGGRGSTWKGLPRPWASAPPFAAPLLLAGFPPRVAFLALLAG